jgi:hypothetical protein
MTWAQLQGCGNVEVRGAGLTGGEQGGGEDVARFGELGDEGDEAFKRGDGFSRAL